MYLCVFVQRQTWCWGCRIHQLLLCRGVGPSPTHNDYPRYDTKQSDGEVAVMLELSGMQSTSL